MENEHLLIFRKSYEIEFPLKVGLFIIKNKVSFPVVEGLLQEMNLMKSTKTKYDPHQIISQRRQQNKKKSFDHKKIEGLSQRNKLMEYQSYVEDLESLQENPLAKMKSTTMIIPTPSKIEIIGKRSFSEVVEVEDEDSKVEKIPKIDL